MRATFEGQALDIGWVAKRTFPDRAEYREMIGRKQAGIPEGGLVSVEH
jgi:hypothetical protein